MREIGIEELKQIELDILSYIDTICAENNLRYYICGGTLIGAVRHGGFIPWDDDIDICMPRVDYEQFRNIVEAKKDYYTIFDSKTVKNYGYPMPKLGDIRTTLIDYKKRTGKEKISVYVDIFVLDGMSNNEKEARFRFNVLRTFKRMIFLSRRNFKMESFAKSVIFFIPCLVLHIIGTDNINKFYTRLCRQKKYDDCYYVASTAGSYGQKELFEKKLFEGGCRLEFENLSFMAPSRYHELLEQLYGDYMKLPPKEKQISHHSTKEWWNE